MQNHVRLKCREELFFIASLSFARNGSVRDEFNKVFHKFVDNRIGRQLCKKLQELESKVIFKFLSRVCLLWETIYLSFKNCFFIELITLWKGWALWCNISSWGQNYHVETSLR
jgi:hypothetical protein